MRAKATIDEGQRRLRSPLILSDPRNLTRFRCRTKLGTSLSRYYRHSPFIRYNQNCLPDLSEFSAIMLDDLKNPLTPLIDSLPPGERDFLAAGGWWIALGVAALVVLVLNWPLLRRSL